MDATALTTLLDHHDGRFVAEHAELRGAAGGIATWEDLAGMLDAWVRHHPTEPAHTIAYTVTNRDTDTVTEVTIKGDPFTIWRWTEPDNHSLTPTRRAPRGTRGRPELADDKVVAVAAELALANGPSWNATGHRRSWGNDYVQRRLGLSRDQVRTRTTRAEQHMANNPDFPAQVEEAIAERRRTLAARIAALTISEGIPYGPAAEHIGVPPTIDGLEEAAGEAVEVLHATADTLVVLLGGARNRTLAAVAQWQADHPSDDLTGLTAAAESYAAQVEAGEARKLTAPKWLPHYQLGIEVVPTGPDRAGD
jgi:hypothetical protein